MTRRRRISREMKEVLRLMGQGWVLEYSLVPTSKKQGPGKWLTQERVGAGGRKKGVHSNTMKGLVDRGLIVLVEEDGDGRGVLTEEGSRAARRYSK